MKRLFLNEQGQIMIESIVAISVGLMSLLSALSLATSALHYNSITDQKLVGSFLAAEGIEIVRNMLDANYVAATPNWADGFSNRTFRVSYDSSEQPAQNLRYCSGVYSYDASCTATMFTRDITTTLISSGGVVYEIAVSSTVKAAGMEDIVVEDHFYNWRK